jgi:hypothetical protein
LADSLEDIYDEILSPMPITGGKVPAQGDTVAVRHPVSDEWVDAKCIRCKDGRVILRWGRDEIQLPLSGVYWDARGGWSEARSRVTPARPMRPQRAQSEMSDGPFVTLSETTKEEEELAEEEPLSRFPILDEPKRSDTRLLLQKGVAMMNTTKFIDRTIKPPETFKGVNLPVKPWRPTITRSSPSRRPLQFVQDVVNISLGAELGYGRKLRRFNVRIENVLTKKSSYIWIGEDEVGPEDIEKLIALYRRHIESKLTIIPGL